MLPADPPVTPETSPNNTPCGSVPIMATPTLPVLADGVFKHTAGFSSAQTVQVKLPDGFTCNGCTLQVIQWMYNHPLNNPGGCFYHHCATVNIVANTDGGTTPSDLSVGPSDLAGTAGTPDLADPNQPMNSTPPGCSCELGASHRSSTAPLGGLLVLLGVAFRRRRGCTRSH